MIGPDRQTRIAVMWTHASGWISSKRGGGGLCGVFFLAGLGVFFCLL